MKNTLKVHSVRVFWIIAIVAVIGFSMSGCKETETAPIPGTVTYTGTADGVTYTLKITENIARYTAQIGDTYELTVGTKKSTGTVEGVTGGTLTLKHSNGAAFTATVNSSGITDMTGTITFDDGTSQPVPTVITPPAPPVTGDNPFKGTWTDDQHMEDEYVTITFGDTSFEYVVAFYDKTPEGNRVYVIQKFKGTYTHTSNTATLTCTGELKINDEEWKFDPDLVGYSFTLTLSNGKLIFPGEEGDLILTKIN